MMKIETPFQRDREKLAKLEAAVAAQRQRLEERYGSDMAQEPELNRVPYQSVRGLSGITFNNTSKDGSTKTYRNRRPR